MPNTTEFFFIVPTIIAVATLLLAWRYPAMGERFVLSHAASLAIPALTTIALSVVAAFNGEHSFVLGNIVIALFAPILTFLSYRPGQAAIVNPLVFFVISLLGYQISGLENATNGSELDYDAVGYIGFCVTGAMTWFVAGLLGLIGAKRNWKLREKYGIHLGTPNVQQPDKKEEW